MKQDINYVALIALGETSSQLIFDITHLVNTCKCNISSFSSNSYGSETGITLWLSGSWSAIAKFEVAVAAFNHNSTAHLVIKRTDFFQNNIKCMTYSLSLMGIDKPGVLHGIVQFLSLESICIDGLSVHTFQSNNGTLMLTINIKINISENTQLAYFRDQILNYCDAKNLDVFIEPFKN